MRNDFIILKNNFINTDVNIGMETGGIDESKPNDEIALQRVIYSRLYLVTLALTVILLLWPFIRPVILLWPIVHSGLRVL